MGYMGSGKSTVGAELSKKLGYKHIDSDSLISNKLGKSITQIFEEEGEPYFRDQEKTTLIGLDEGDNVILSSGGGLPCNESNIEFINDNYTAVYLHLNVNRIIGRLSDIEQDSRPLLKEINSKEELKDYVENKLLERERFYFDSVLIVDADQSVEDVVSDIYEYLKKYGSNVNFINFEYHH